MTIKSYVTYAVLAVAASAGAASAADKLNVGVGGDFYSAFTAQGLVGGGNNVDKDSKTVKYDHTNVRQDAYIRFTGDTVLDNGIKVGAKAEFEALTGNDQLHAQDLYISIGNKFGDVIAGRSQTAAAQSHVYIPSVGAAIGFGVDDANLAPYNAATHNANAPFLGASDVTTDASRQLIAQYAPRISYFTPRIQGLRLGASYAPQGTADTGAQSGFTTQRHGGHSSNEASLSADYNRKVGKVDVTASGGYTFANGNYKGFSTTDTTVDPAVTTNYDTKRPQAYQGGLALAYNGFTLGGAYGEARYKLLTPSDTETAAPFSKNRLRTYGGGLKYETGPWAFGVSGLEQRTTQKFADEATDPSKDRQRVYEAGVNYILGPGVTTGAGVYYNEVKSSTVKDSVTGAVGLGLHF